MEDQFFRLAVALSIGLLVGLERGWREREGPSGSRTAGLGTLAIFGLLGGIFALLAVEMEAPAVFATGCLGAAALFGCFQFLESARERRGSSP